MSEILVIGGQGYVGSAYVRLFERLGMRAAVATRQTYHAFVGRTFDIVVNANGNSVKFLADRDPRTEFDASVRSVARSLEDFPCGRYVMLSSGDVYPDTHSPSVTVEEQTLDASRQSRYGFHKHLAEQLVLKVHPRPLIMRMGGFVGSGMRKNAVFDMLNDQSVWLTPESELQFIRTDTAAEIVWSLVQSDIVGEIVNLGSTGVIKIADLYSRIGSASTYAEAARAVRFELSVSKLQGLLGRTLPSTEMEIEAFLGTIGG